MSFRIDDVNRFVNTMLDSEEKFSQGIKDYEDKQIKIEQIFKTLQNNLNELFKSSENVSDNADISALKKNISNVLSECIENGISKILETGKGMNFIKKHEKTFVVSVFGKVKSGKSSLGNFIMGNEIKKLGVHSEYDKISPVVIVEDRGKISQNTFLETISEDDEGFGVGSTETTSTIQYFKIGGLTWFDTPGIGSITKENEELAKEYIQNSDLVVFTCSSDAAGTQQEFKEMKRFSDMKKPVLLMVTMSDTYDEDCDDDGNIIKVLLPKSDKDRKDVEEYIINKIRDEGLDDILKYSSVITVSKQLAVEAFRKNDDELYKQSNLPLFFDKLIDITQNEAAQMKLATPMKRIRSMISDVIGSEETESLTKLKHTLMQNIKELNNQIKNLEIKKEQIRSIIKSQSMAKIQNLISKYSTEINNNKQSISSEQISQDVVNIIAETSQKICEQELSEFITANSSDIFRNMKSDGFSIPEMKMKTESISYKVELVERCRRQPKGIWENISSFIFKTEYHENRTRTQTKYSTFDVGINESEIWNAVISQINTYFSDNVEVQIDEIVNMYFQPVIELNRKSSELIDNAIAELNSVMPK